MVKGSCLCGAVRFEVDGPLPDATACHCGMCRRHHGSLCVCTSTRADSYRIEGLENIRWYRSSHGSERGFCERCGSKLFGRFDGEDALDVTMGTLEPPTGLRIRAHIWVGSKGDYYTIGDGVPMYQASSSSGPRLDAEPQVQAVEMPKERYGRCLCGSVTFRLKGAARGVVACHCGICVHWHGHAPSYTSSTWTDIELSGADKIRWYESSDHARRGFCNDCGSSLFWEPQGGNRVSISAGSLEPPTGLRTVRHIFVADKADYYEIADGMPQSPGSMASEPVTN